MTSPREQQQAGWRVLIKMNSDISEGKALWAEQNLKWTWQKTQMELQISAHKSSVSPCVTPIRTSS